MLPLQTLTSRWQHRSRFQPSWAQCLQLPVDLKPYLSFNSKSTHSTQNTPII